MQRLLDGIETGDWDGAEQHLTPEALYDGSMPGWRAQYEGPSRITQEYRGEWTGKHVWQVAERHVTQTDDTVVVDFEIHGTSPTDGSQPARDVVCRIVNVFRLDDGRSAEHRFYCCGEWDAATVRQIETEAPRVDRTRALR